MRHWESNESAFAIRHHDINRVPVFFGDYFFLDFVPSPEDTPVYDL